MEDGAVDSALRKVAERAIALAATGRWSPADQQEVIETLNALEPAAPPPGIIEIGDDDRAHASVFPLRGGAVLPLHDHPGMTVICKVFHGRMRIESFEWIDQDSGLARSLGAREADPAAPALVFGPQPGTVHRITALTDCAFIDLFAPYYDDDRPCSYFRIREQRAGGVAVLEPTGEVAP